ncbi:MAG: radical SAM protein [Polyangiaceae bacterium]|nr:radical SAM protein [Polyangiaceae bacterium]
MGTQQGGFYRFDDGAAGPRLGTGERAVVPWFVQWMVTEECDLTCPHCLSSPPSGHRELELEVVPRLLDELGAMGVPELLLTGGEPLQRRDLPRILQLIQERGLTWSLNTARLPGPRQRAAIEAWPPSFVAVSLDGPTAVHERIRGRPGSHAEALAAIRYFADLGVEVAAGTTVTRENISELAATHELVQRIGASAWGLHLVVPEGRARHRPDLFPRRAELRRMVEFVATQRRLGGVPMGMADEIGYCGPWEPLVRESRFYCGAGRITCVILSDGEVVPCTTTDRSTSAGNVRHGSFAEIWARGFAALAACPPRDDCASCSDLDACGGGCWLMRRHGRHCFRDLWTTRRGLSRLGVGLGLAASACSNPQRATEPVPVDSASPSSTAASASAVPATGLRASAGVSTPAPTAPSPGGAVASAALTPSGAAEAARALSDWLSTHRWELCGSSPSSTQLLAARLGTDPLGAYLAELERGGCGRELTARVAALRAAQATRFRLPVVASIWWRDLAEWALDQSPPALRSDAERVLLATALRELAPWSRAALVAQLEPTIRVPEAKRPGSFSPGSCPYKHGRCPPVPPSKPTPAQRHRAATAEVAAHPPGHGLSLTVLVPAGTVLTFKGPSEERTMQAGASLLGAFDLLVVPAGAPVTVQVTSASMPASSPEDRIEVRLPAGVELTLLDLAALAAEENPDLAARLQSERHRVPSAIGLVISRSQARASGAHPLGADGGGLLPPGWLM